MRFKLFVVVIILLIIDMLSTLWLSTHAPTGQELNPVMAMVLGDTVLFVLSKTFFSCVVLGCLYRLSTQSIKVFNHVSVAVCVFFGFVCINNMIGVVLLW